MICVAVAGLLGYWAGKRAGTNTRSGWCDGMGRGYSMGFDHGFMAARGCLMDLLHELEGDR